MRSFLISRVARVKRHARVTLALPADVDSSSGPRWSPLRRPSLCSELAEWEVLTDAASANSQERARENEALTQEDSSPCAGYMVRD